MVEAVAVGALLADARGRLAAGGVSAPEREVLRIWADLTGRRPGDAVLARYEALHPALAARLEEAFARRAAGEPLAHVTGVAGFRHLELAIDSRALIPRPETEGLVDLVLARVRRGRAADVGTGSGCIALSLVTEGDFERVIAVDCSRGALELAGLNAGRAARRMTGRLEVIRGDLVSMLGDASIDALVSNPPYLSEAEYASLDESVRRWEPAMALVSGVDGMLATRALLDDGRRVVADGGWIALEVDCSRAAHAAGCASALGWRDVTVQADLFGRERYLLARRSARS
ncbi:MAG: peptide chain release factor N(5)-glutamine methyltransferase [Gemmatimonadales bacterium]|nr:peptide chain release factor N(5)-glutamine methyltransferase [Gemmatimonadales bacterium]